MDAAGSAGTHTSLALDALGRARISYAEEPNLGLKVAFATSTGWRRERVGVLGDFTSSGTSLALNDLGHPFVSYEGDAGLRIAFADRLRWHTMPVDSLGSDSSLVLDADGLPHVSYDGSRGDPPQYASFTGSGWTIEQVAPGDTSFGTSLALDPKSGLPRIAYKSGTATARLKYAVRGPGGAWTVQTVATGAGFSPSLALDASGLGHVSFRTFVDGALMYASQLPGGGWNIQTVDATGQVGSYSSLALDADGHAHISYYDSTNGAVKYAQENAADQWSIVTVDSFGNAGLFTSVALDASGHAHISYAVCNFTGEDCDYDLRYASQT